MRLNKITYRNFKGLIDFALELNGKNAVVFGDNGTGKTSLYDGFLWPITGKDSQNKTDFSIKTIDTTTGDTIPNLDHEVEAELTYNGKTFTLKKVFSEKWTQKHGQAKKDFTGHETAYFIDGVPKSKKDYDAFIAAIIDEKTLKILTNPLFFNDDDAMKTKTDSGWKVRRNILMEICGDISDAEVIASDKALAGLPAILQGRQLADHREIIKARQSKINEELKKIPVRIDEVNKGLPDIARLNKATLEADISTFKEQLNDKRSELARIESGGEVAEKQKRHTEIETELMQISNLLKADTDKLIDAQRAELSEAKKKLGNLQDGQSMLLRNQSTTNSIIKEINGKLTTLRDEWKQENDKQFTIEQNNACPACGQALPAEQLQDAYSKALEDFNLKKSTALTKINQRGKDLKEELIKSQDQLPIYETNLAQFESDIAAQEKLIADFVTIPPVDVAANPEYQAKMEEKITVADELTDLRQGTITQSHEIHNEMERISVALLAMETNLRSIELHQQGQERITELEDQESKLAKEFEKLEGELFLTEQFVKAKVNMLEEKINSKFKLARFKLFETQINGGLNECCETLSGNVPYSSGLNHGGCINVGLDIINTLSEHYDFYPVIFIDNAEAVTELAPVKAQIIELVVSKPDKVLRVEAY